MIRDSHFFSKSIYFVTIYINGLINRSITLIFGNHCTENIFSGMKTTRIY